ncbi:helix-turn-helix domain-containing protein [Albibacterium bauzanense]|uniref:PAS domain S-box-containing protein n=1 Tax=Albibacterium bauzanense TaxID=653929 RepID=A0A4R1LQ73_9SPHI|nr:helix-turn-helix domain-containing protein [Albibacterium bauzanense]TCK80597.1 PAS domain S-box-containing protein [Albibacterium bauzanense]
MNDSPSIDKSAVNTPDSKGSFDLEKFFELSPDLLCIAGYDGYFKKINAAVSKTLGYTKEELFERLIIDFVHVEDREETLRTRRLIRNNDPLLRFENRYITKSNEIVWLTWTSMTIESEKVIFAIAKDITYRKKLEEYRRIADILGNSSQEGIGDEYSAADQAWLSEFEKLIRKYTGKIELNINMLSNEMAMSERQLFRRTKAIMGITPNQYIRIIRLQIAKEAIKTGKYRTVSEIAYLAGFETPAYFNKLFKGVYSFDVGELL